MTGSLWTGQQKFRFANPCTFFPVLHVSIRFDHCMVSYRCVHRGSVIFQCNVSPGYSSSTLSWGICGAWRTLAEVATIILLLEGEPLHGIRYAAYGAVHVRPDRVADINLVRSSFTFFA